MFVGIESPNPAALLETRKFQNVDRRQPRGEQDAGAAESFILDRIHRIQSKGIKVTCGLILGFDSDTQDIFESHRHFIAKTGILHVMVGLLAAIPKTPLYERLRREGGSTRTISPSSAPTSCPPGWAASSWRGVSWT